MSILPAYLAMSLVKPLRIVVSLALALFASPAFAHEASSSYLYWQDSEPNQLRLDIALSDLIANTELSADAQNELRWQDLLDQESQLAAVISEHVGPREMGKTCPTSANLVGLTEHSNSTYSVWQVSWLCSAEQINYTLFAREDALHRALATLLIDGTPELHVLSASSPQTNLDGTNSPLATFGQFIYQGMLHMWLGLDHVLFLLTLLMLVFNPSPATSKPESSRMRQLILVVSSFTLAHSITLVLSSLALIQLSSAFVETLIAASIVVSAIKVLMPRWQLNTLLISFGFGLLHGMGFASVLADLIAQTPSKLTALFGFNIGVELAQLCLVLAAFPLMSKLQNNPQLRSLIFRSCAGTVALMGLFWSLQRSGILLMLG